MKKRIPPLPPAANKPGINLLKKNLLTTNLLKANFLKTTALTTALLTATLLTLLPASASSTSVTVSADSGKGGPSVNVTITPVQRGLSGQDATQPWTSRMTTYGGLPETNLDSFVYQAGSMADQIYGDESIQGQPEFMEFGPSHRINAGIQGVNAAGLTTGHGSYMPSAWGRDEFISSGGEWYQSGSGSYDFPADPTEPVDPIDTIAKSAVNEVFAQIPNALSSSGTAGANGLGRVLGLPGTGSFNMTPTY